MDKKKRGKRPSENQKEYLITYLEQHLEVVQDRFESVDGARAREQTWSALADDLNSIGGACKDGPTWKKYWSDLKQYIKEKAAIIREKTSQSGVNGPSKIKLLTALEERIVNLLTPQAVEGDLSTSELGVENQAEMSVEQQERLPSAQGHAVTPEPSTSQLRGNSSPHPQHPIRQRRNRRNTAINSNLIKEIMDLEKEKLEKKELYRAKMLQKKEESNNLKKEIVNLLKDLNNRT